MASPSPSWPRLSHGRPGREMFAWAHGFDSTRVLSLATRRDTKGPKPCGAGIASENAVRIQIALALIAFLLLRALQQISRDAPGFLELVRLVRAVHTRLASVYRRLFALSRGRLHAARLHSPGGSPRRTDRRVPCGSLAGTYVAAYGFLFQIRQGVSWAGLSPLTPWRTRQAFARRQGT